MPIGHHSSRLDPHESAAGWVLSSPARLSSGTVTKRKPSSCQPAGTWNSSSASAGIPSVPSGSRTLGIFLSYIAWTITASPHRDDERPRPATAPRNRSEHPSFVEAQPTVQQSDDRRQLILQPGRRADLPQCEPSILQRLEHSERFVKVKNETGGTGSSPLGSSELIGRVCSHQRSSAWNAAACSSPNTSIRRSRARSRTSGSSRLPAAIRRRLLLNSRYIPRRALERVRSALPKGAHFNPDFNRNFCRAGRSCCPSRQDLVQAVGRNVSSTSRPRRGSIAPTSRKEASTTRSPVSGADTQCRRDPGEVVASGAGRTPCVCCGAKRSLRLSADRRQLFQSNSCGLRSALAAISTWRQTVCPTRSFGQLDRIPAGGGNSERRLAADA